MKSTDEADASDAGPTDAGCHGGHCDDAGANHPPFSPNPCDGGTADRLEREFDGGCEVMGTGCSGGSFDCSPTTDFRPTAASAR